MESVQGLDPGASPMSVQPPPPRDEPERAREPAEEAPVPSESGREVDTYA
jgi:hypothetical protein